ncbi:helix-turn-helix domain-containing protein [Synechococcales cyanobacterium CNB]|nr:helix-turn-helix domain-containing protein [Synechococcales cyanobacterium CNB]
MAQQIVHPELDTNRLLSDLSGPELKVLVALDTLADSDGLIRATNKMLAELTGMDDRNTIPRHTASLQKAGWLRIENDAVIPRVFRIVARQRAISGAPARQMRGASKSADTCTTDEDTARHSSENSGYVKQGLRIDRTRRDRVALRICCLPMTPWRTVP